MRARVGETIDLQLDFGQPVARTSDPSTSRHAAEITKPGNAEMIKAIRKWVFAHGPATSWEIADGVLKIHGDRWQHDSIRTACSRAALIGREGAGESPRGRPCILYSLSWSAVPVGAIL